MLNQRKQVPDDDRQFARDEERLSDIARVWKGDDKDRRGYCLGGCDGGGCGKGEVRGQAAGANGVRLGGSILFSGFA